MEDDLHHLDDHLPGGRVVDERLCQNPVDVVAPADLFAEVLRDLVDLTVLKHIPRHYPKSGPAKRFVAAAHVGTECPAF